MEFSEGKLTNINIENSSEESRKILQISSPSEKKIIVKLFLSLHYCRFMTLKLQRIKWLTLVKT